LKKKILQYLTSRPAVLITAVLYSILIICGSTFSWYTTADTIINDFEGEKTDFEDGSDTDVEYQNPAFHTILEEIFVAPTAEELAAPGDTYTKKPTIVNDGGVDAFGRIRVIPMLVAVDGLTVLPSSVDDGKIVLVGLDTTHWKYGGDGWYYYLGTIPRHGGETEPLFTDVTLSDNINTLSAASIYDNTTLTVTVLAETIEIDKWHYRLAWWKNTNEATTSTLSGTLATVDNTLAALAQ